MAAWTEYLPEGVVNPIVLHVRHPAKWRGNSDQDKVARRKAQKLVDDREFLDSRNQLVKSLGADHVTVLSIRDEGVEKKDVDITVYLPSTVRTDDDTAVSKVMSWFESSKLGKIYYGVGKQHGMGDVNISAAHYNRVAEIEHLKLEADPEEEHSRGHCACH